MDNKARTLESKLRRIRMWRRISFLLLIGWMPWGISVMSLVDSSSIQTQAIFGYMLVCGLFTGIAVLSSCPRCGNLFFLKVFSNAFFSSECIHCGQAFPDD